MQQVSGRMEQGAVDVVAMRQELAMREPAELGSAAFERFVIRLCERIDFDIPREDYVQLLTIHGCCEYVQRVCARAN